MTRSVSTASASKPDSIAADVPAPPHTVFPPARKKSAEASALDCVKWCRSVMYWSVPQSLWIVMSLLFQKSRAMEVSSHELAHAGTPLMAL